MRKIIALLLQLGLVLIRALFLFKVSRQENLEVVKKNQQKLDKEAHVALTQSLQQNRKSKPNLKVLQEQMDQDILK